MAVVRCLICRSATATDPCQRCGSYVPPPADPRRLDRLWAATGLVGVLAGVIAAAGHGSLAANASPEPVGLYVTVLGTAVAALWFIARAFAARR